MDLDQFKTANLAGLQRDNEVAVLQWLMGVFLVTIKAIERRTKKKVNEDKALMWWGVIKKHYCEKTRFYHTYQHLVDLCKHVEQYQNKLKRPELVRMTVFFHDVIYDATKRDNEERSAQMWTTFSQELHLPPADVDAVHEWIMATAKHMYATPERNSDMAYFLDFDLSVLGRERDAYERYSREIRQEYSHFPEVEYRAGRGGVLAMFLSTERLFFTDDVHAALEARARENIAWEIELLQQPIGIDVHLQEEADRLAREAAAATEVVNKQVEETLSAAADTLASFSPVLARHLGRPVPGDEPTTTASSTTSTSTSTSTPTTATATTTSTSPPSTSSSPPVRTIPAFRPRGAFAEAASKQ